jgi:hypothetical protein
MGQPPHLAPAPTVWLFPLACRLKPLACFRKFDLDRVLSGLGGGNTKKCAGLGLSSEFTFPLQVRGQRAADRLAELRDGSNGPPALRDTFGPILGGFRGR